MHISVLQKEVFKYLNPQPNENFIDCTISGAGHSLAILERTSPNGRLLGIDFDQEILKNTEYKIQDTKYKNRLILACDNFANLKNIVKKEKFNRVNGIIFDLGMSSWHLEQSNRGFSFLKNEPLDMRYDKKMQNAKCKSQNENEKLKINDGLTAKKIVNEFSERVIEKILKEYGEERFAKKIANKIIENRKIKLIESTFQLVEIIKSAVPLWYQRKRIHFATRTFQALRIAVNDELNNLKVALPQALEILGPGGRLVVISFHSLEDRIVKHFFKNKTESLKILTKKPIIPTKEEVEINPRSRSAKLRAVIKNYEN